MSTPQAFSVDCTPLAKPENAFARAARGLAGKYPSKQQMEKAKELRQFLVYLAGRKEIPCESTEPLLLIALARMATDGAERRRMRAVLDGIDRVIEELNSGTAAPASDNGAGGYELEP